MHLLKPILYLKQPSEPGRHLVKESICYICVNFEVSRHYYVFTKHHKPQLFRTLNKYFPRQIQGSACFRVQQLLEFYCFTP